MNFQQLLASTSATETVEPESDFAALIRAKPQVSKKKPQEPEPQYASVFGPNYFQDQLEREARERERRWIREQEFRYRTDSFGPSPWMEPNHDCPICGGRDPQCPNRR